MRREDSLLLSLSLTTLLLTIILGYFLSSPAYILLSLALLLTLIAYASGYKILSIVFFNIVIAYSHYEQYRYSSILLQLAHIVIVLLSILFTYFWEENKKNTATIRLDELTGLPLRKGFSSFVERRMQNPTKTFQAVLFLDIDDFKIINDTYGHAVGDETLEKIAVILKSVLREGDFISRWGGDEFVMFVESPGMTRDDIHAVVHRLMAALKGIVIQKEKTLTMSIGIAYRVTSEDTLEELVRLADVRMYKAKSKQKNCAYDGETFFS